MAANIFCFPCKVCDRICLGIGDMCKSPFFLYVTVATCLNVPPAIYSIISLLEHIKSNNDINESNCRGKLWLTLNLIFCIFNVAAAWYLYCKIRKSFGYENTEFQNRTTAYDRASYILCHDPIMTIYILTLAVFCIWQCVGIIWMLGGSDCPEYIFDPFASSLGFGWAFLFGGSCAFCCSLCCTCCDPRDNYGTNNGKNDHQQQQINTNTNQNQQQQQQQQQQRPIGQPNSVYVPEHSVVTGLSSPTKSEAVPQRVHTNDPDMPYTEIPVAIAVPLPPPTAKGEV